MNSEIRHRCQSLTEEARMLLQAADVAGACRGCEAALRMKPDLVGARLLHARALLGLNRADEALRTLHAIEMYRKIDGRPLACGARLRWLMLHAQTLQRLHRGADARGSLREVLEIEPLHRGAILRLAASLIAVEPGAAIEPLERLLAVQQEDPTARRLLARALEAAGKTEQAMRERVRLGDRTLHVARLCVKAGRRADALNRYDELLRVNPDDAELHLEAAMLAGEIGDDRRARRLLEHALTLRPMHAGAMMALAEQHLRTGRYEAATPLLWRLGHQRHDPQALAGLLACAVQLGRSNLARRVHARLTALSSDAERRRLIRRAWTLALTGSLARQAVRGHLPEKRASVLNVMLNEAEGILRQVRQEKPGHADLHYHHAVCREHLGDERGAAESLDVALKLNPRYAAAIERRQKLAA